MYSCLGKVIEKVASELLGRHYAEQETLHPHQFDARKKKSAVEAVATLVDTVEKTWADKQIVGALRMDIAAAFPSLSEKSLREEVRNVGVDENLVGWKFSFMRERRIQMVIDGHEEEEMEVTTGLPQGSAVSPILFIIYIREVHGAVEDKCDFTSISFVDGVRWLAKGRSVVKV